MDCYPEENQHGNIGLKQHTGLDGLDGLDGHTHNIPAPTAEHTFFPRAHATFSKRDQMLGYKQISTHFKRLKSYQASMSTTK